MKTKFGILLVVVMLLSLIPASAFAAAPAELTVKVKNNTGAPVSIRATAADGVITWLELPAGISEVTMTEGLYEYYAVTVCGTQVGTWNLNVTKVLEIECNTGAPVVDFYKQCPDNFYVHYWYVPDYDTHFGDYWDDDDIYEWIEWRYGYVPFHVDLGIGCWSDKADFGWRLPF